MAIPKTFSLARMTSATTGAGTITLGSAATIGGVTYITFANAGVADGDIVAYGIQDTSGSNTEYGYGTYTAAGTTLTRNVIRSSNSNNAINLSGTETVFVTEGNAELLWGFDTARNLGLTASVAASALTIAIKGWDGADPSANNPLLVPFRSSTAATGTPTLQALRAATSLVISSGSTMGCTNSVAFRIWIVLFDDAGTLRLGAIQRITGGQTPSAVAALAEYGIASSTAEGGAGAADSAGVFYTGSAVSSKAYRILGYMDWASGLATVGTWASGPTTIQLFSPSMPQPGDIIQSVVATASSSTTVSSTTLTVTTLTVSITPTAAPNLIKVVAVGSMRASTAGDAAIATLRRGTGTNIGAALDSSTNATSAEVRTPACFVALDAPNTTSSTAYAVYLRILTAGTAYFPDDVGVTPSGYILVEEVMA